ncbi:MAG: bifunctional (p)ppGpp synthetase/guanosine-3',5'-bis(diphosphate) 3'-pyrophosphohydrolase, partial [Bdellovibrionales bacterium]|nr:bifunctional (p)ppGpp synthetase/guanosine-3',5'-bis(diphosphate) 3'-pyrophosphohydrolase [Bdellovibrionales bacterium]
KYIDDVKKMLAGELEKNFKGKAEVQGRPKHLYSIHRKMDTRGIDYEQVYDVLAFRICVESISECYEVLGIVHSLWKPIPGRFKDFIAMPKANNYQSLHTTVNGPGGERIEIQIRTFSMQVVAEMGIAAHWKYKESSRGSKDDIDPSVLEKFNWLRELVNLHQSSASADEFLENVKTDLFESEIYVFTPKGDVKEFPEGATPIDFAYSVHTDVGNHIVAARINGKLVSLKYQLQNGDRVEIITSKNQTPSKDWLKFCVTTRAKSKIRSHVKAEQRKRALEIGRELLEKQTRKFGVSSQKVLVGDKFNEYLKTQGCNNLEDLYIRVGFGYLTPQQVWERVVPDAETLAETKDENFLQKAFRAAVHRTKKTASLIQVDGMDDVLVRFAKCCGPIPGDSIVGFITRGRGIVIHRADCEKAFELDQDRRIDVSWSGFKAPGAVRMVRLRVLSQDVAGLLKQMTEVFSSFGVNIHNAQARTLRDGHAICNFDISVHDTEQLSQVSNSLRKLKGVIDVTRVTNI